MISLFKLSLFNFAVDSLKKIVIPCDAIVKYILPTLNDIISLSELRMSAAKYFSMIASGLTRKMSIYYPRIQIVSTAYS